jgi:hypothetical protein
MRNVCAAALILLAVPRVALACPVCFGQSDSPMALGVNMGIFLLLGVTGAMLAAFAGFFIYLIRRARLFAEDPARAAADGGAAEAVLHARPRGGVAQC